ncbi:hypothetical protein PC110_g4703 [Phytophthora cactorum]|uniref:Uncharacterized protein n=1 Tax=Phytophthora cactorum TaxID=29920 RepID=A0A329SQ73_9STRA|nr:hypothetical protein PC110_g4703 [Phytophthora cactorum]
MMLDAIANIMFYTCLCTLKALTNEAERDGGGDTAFETPAFAIDADPNLTDQGANQCTGLNFDEDPGVCEEPEGEVSVPSISALKSEHIIQTNSRVPPKKYEI